VLDSVVVGVNTLELFRSQESKAAGRPILWTSIRRVLGTCLKAEATSITT